MLFLFLLNRGIIRYHSRHTRSFVFDIIAIISYYVLLDPILLCLFVPADPPPKCLLIECHSATLTFVYIIFQFIHTIPHFASNALHNLVQARAADRGYRLMEIKSSV